MLHGSYVAPRRKRVLARHLCEMLPRDASVLDVGCGDGALSKIVHDARPDLRVSGLEVLRRPETFIPLNYSTGLACHQATRAATSSCSSMFSITPTSLRCC